MKVFILCLFLISFSAKAIAEEITFAEIDDSGNVLRVIVADQNFINSGRVGNPKNWIRTFKTNTRKNYAGPGFKYDANRDAFIPPKPFPSWVLNEETARWEPLEPYPKDGKEYQWDENAKKWKAK